MSFLGRRERKERQEVEAEYDNEIVHRTRLDVESDLKGGIITPASAVQQFPDILMGGEGQIPSWSLPLIRKATASHSAGRYVFTGSANDACGVYHAASIRGGEDYLVTRVAVWRDAMGRDRYFHDPIVAEKERESVIGLVKLINDVLDGKVSHIPGVTPMVRARMR